MKTETSRYVVLNALLVQLSLMSRWYDIYRKVECWCLCLWRHRPWHTVTPVQSDDCFTSIFNSLKGVNAINYSMMCVNTHTHHTLWIYQTECHRDTWANPIHWSVIKLHIHSYLKGVYGEQLISNAPFLDCGGKKKTHSAHRDFLTMRRDWLLLTTSPLRWGHAVYSLYTFKQLVKQGRIQLCAI